MDFPDSINNKPSRANPPRPAPLLTPEPVARVSSLELEMAKQTQLLTFIAGWVLAGSLFVVMSLILAIVGGGVYLFFNNPVMLVFAALGLVLLLLLTLAGVSTLRRLVFNTIKLRV